MILCSSEVKRLFMRRLKLDGLGVAGSSNSSPALLLWLSKHYCLKVNNLLVWASLRLRKSSVLDLKLPDQGDKFEL